MGNIGVVHECLEGCHAFKYKGIEVMFWCVEGIFDADKKLAPKLKNLFGESVENSSDFSEFTLSEDNLKKVLKLLHKKDVITNLEYLETLARYE